MIEVSAGNFWKQHVHHVKEFYTSKRLFLAPERTEVENNDDEFFALPVGVSGEENDTFNERSNTSATSAPDSDPELTSTIERPTWNFHLDNALSISIKYPQDME